MSAPDAAASLADVTAVVPAGGSGSRLWPLSRQAAPKFVHDLTGSGKSLLQETVDRARPLVSSRVLVVCGAGHAHLVREQLPELSSDALLVEPAPRNSMPAIGWAAAVLEQTQGPDAILAAFPADQVIGDLDVFYDRLTQAVAVARQGWLVTLGITPDYPATGFGYIRAGESCQIAGAPDAQQVESFVEKPDSATAQQYLDAGDYLWNAGMFVVRASRLLDLLEQTQPDMAETLRAIVAAPESLSSRWDSLAATSIDYAVAEPAAAARQVAVIPAPFGWDDVGDFRALGELVASGSGRQPVPGSELQVLGRRESVLGMDSTGVVAPHGDRLVVTLGVQDIVIVDTPDALLVTTRDRCQDVGDVVRALRSQGREEVT